MRAPAPQAGGLERLAGLRIPARLAEELSEAHGVALALFEPAGKGGRRLAGDAPSPCLDAYLDGWPPCVAEPQGLALTRVMCAEGRGAHLVAPVVSGDTAVAYVLTGGALAEAGGEVERWVRVIAEEMARFLEGAPRSSPAGEFPELIGALPEFAVVREELRRALEVRYPVLVLGESGTGKDLVAWLLHHKGPRRKGPYVSLNCAALPEQLLESELFGHRRGAFTSADRDKPGLMEVARGGTLFLDEIQHMSLAAQAKLLRAAETGEFMPLGATAASRSDARLVCATNTDLHGLVGKGTFRQDLFYRLSVLSIHMPPLRDVRGDIPQMVVHFLHKICEREKRPVPAVAAEVMGAFLSSPWPGNVRQLIHELERAVLRCDGREIQLEHLSFELRPLAPEKGRFNNMREQVAEAWEREEIRRGLERTEWNVSKLARQLGLSRRGLTAKIARYRLRRPSRGTAGTGYA